MTEVGPATDADRNFILQQGLEAPGPASCTPLSSAIAAGFWITAWVLQAFFLMAVAALVFGRFCLGSFIYHLARGRLAFAIGTLPWGRGA